MENYNRIVNRPLSGSVYTINDQCELALGGGSKFCSGLTVSITHQ